MIFFKSSNHTPVRIIRFFFSSKLFDDEILTITNTQKWCFSKFFAARKQELQIKLESKHENVSQTTIYQYSRTRRWRKFQKGRNIYIYIYNSEEQVPIEFVRVTCFNNAHFKEPFFFNMCGSQNCTSANHPKAYNLAFRFSLVFVTRHNHCSPQRHTTF